MCILSAPRDVYTLAQYLQLNDLRARLPSAAAQWYCWCFERPEYVEYDLAQSGHWYRGLRGADTDMPESEDTEPGERKSSGHGGGEHDEGGDAGE